MALALTLLVLAALFDLASPAVSLNQSLLETANVQQRLRHAFDRLHTDLLAAGRGTTTFLPGPLSRFLPPVVPYRVGLRVSGGEHRHARPGVVTTLSVSRTGGSETRIASPLVGPAPVVRIDSGPGCAPPVCGYVIRDLVLVFDEGGAWELFRVTGTSAMTLALARAHATATTFAPGAVVAPVELHHYYIDPARAQLRHYDGWRGDFPVVDDLVDLKFRFFGVAPTSAPACQGTAPAPPRGPLAEIGLAALTDGPLVRAGRPAVRCRSAAYSRCGRRSARPERRRDAAWRRPAVVRSARSRVRWASPGSRPRGQLHGRATQHEPAVSVRGEPVTDR